MSVERAVFFIAARRWPAGQLAVVQHVQLPRRQRASHSEKEEVLPTAHPSGTLSQRSCNLCLVAHHAVAAGGVAYCRAGASPREKCGSRPWVAQPSMATHQHRHTAAARQGPGHCMWRIHTHTHNHIHTGAAIQALSHRIAVSRSSAYPRASFTAWLRSRAAVATSSPHNRGSHRELLTALTSALTAPLQARGGQQGVCLDTA